MPERLVVSFRGLLPVVTGGGKSYVERALATKERAEALGATLCAWSAQTFSFDLSPDDLEEAIELAKQETTDATVPETERFMVGVSQGLLDTVGAGKSIASLSWGRPLVTAVSLARIARPGEVLLDPELPALKRGELLSRGSRIALDGGRRVRAAVLDANEPWRKQAAKAVAKLVVPPLLARQRELEQVLVPVGCVGVVRADPGAGGSRFLAELATRFAPSRLLVLSPVGASREPLGSIRRALSRSSAMHGSPQLPERLHGALARVLAGDGADAWAVAEVVDAWLAPKDGHFGVLAIDDAADVDVASLEAAATALQVRSGFRMVVRVGSAGELPRPLAVVPAGGGATLAPLGRDDARLVASAFLDGRVSPEVALRWAKRGQGMPLGIRSALAESLTSGELGWSDAAATPRQRSSGRGGAQPAGVWYERRTRFLGPEERALLIALALLGGDASDGSIEALASKMRGAPTRIARVEEELLSCAWAARPEPGWLKLLSRTARDVLVRSIGPAARARCHVAAADVVESHAGQLGRADAAWHAAQAGDKARAAALAIDAARAAIKVGLESAAIALFAFAQEHDPARADAARSEASRVALGSIPPAGASIPPSSDGHQHGEVHTPRPHRPRLDTLMEEAMLEADPFAQTGPNPAADIEVTISIDDDAFELLRRTGASPAAARVAIADEGTDPAAVARELVDRAKEALVQGDVETLETLIAELRVTGEHAELVERMTGIVALARGAKSDALRKLRAAAHEDRAPKDRARALLAYAVALAAAGRLDGALLETLDALARAKEASDRQGQHACERFLARLSSASGHSRAAAAWSGAAKRTAAPR